MELKKFYKIYCPICGKEMSADTHDEYPEIDNWWCGECELFIDPEDLINMFPIGINNDGTSNEEDLKKLKELYGIKS